MSPEALGARNLLQRVFLVKGAAVINEAQTSDGKTAVNFYSNIFCGHLSICNRCPVCCIFAWGEVHWPQLKCRAPRSIPYDAKITSPMGICKVPFPKPYPGVLPPQPFLPLWPAVAEGVSASDSAGLFD